MSIGSKVRKYREQKGFSQDELARLLEVGQTTISIIESDKNVPNAILLLKISEILGVSLEELLESYKTTINNIKKNNGLVWGDNNHNNTIYNLSEKLIEQYESRLKEKDETIMYLRNRAK